MIDQIIASYKAVSSANTLQYDHVLETLSPEEPLASQPPISRFFGHVTDQTIDELQKLNQVMIDQARLVRNDMNMIIDLDSTHSDTFGIQEQINYNAHYQKNGDHPLVALDGLNGDFLKVKLRLGNQYTSKGVKKFFGLLLKHYEATLPVTDILVRDDNGFATAAIYDLCEEHNNHLVIRLENNKKLYRAVEEFVYDDNQIITLGMKKSLLPFYPI